MLPLRSAGCKDAAGGRLPVELPPCLPASPSASLLLSSSLPPPLSTRAPPPGAFNDWNKDRQFQKLNAQKDIIEVKVQRGGQTMTVRNYELVVGDVMLLDTGDKVVADGYTIEVGGARAAPAAGEVEGTNHAAGR